MFSSSFVVEVLHLHHQSLFASPFRVGSDAVSRCLQAPLLGRGGGEAPFSIKKISLTATTALAKGQYSIIKKAKNSVIPTVYHR